MALHTRQPVKHTPQSEEPQRRCNSYPEAGPAAATDRLWAPHKEHGCFQGVAYTGWKLQDGEFLPGAPANSTANEFQSFYNTEPWPRTTFKACRAASSSSCTRVPRYPRPGIFEFRHWYVKRSTTARVAAGTVVRTQKSYTRRADRNSYNLSSGVRQCC
eukprot:2367690-Rhodomonas_salina.2